MKLIFKQKDRLPLGAGTDGLYSQELFRDLLVHEQKRSERSKRQFIFVAIDVKDVLTNTHEDVEVVKNIVTSVIDSSREVDIKGWYEAPICIGIIYTEVSVAAIGQILDKIKKVLSSSIPEELLSRIGITYSIFPTVS